MASSVIGETFVDIRASFCAHASARVTGVAHAIPRARRVDTLMSGHATTVVSLALVDVHATIISNSVALPTGVTRAGEGAGAVGARRLCTCCSTIGNG